MGKKISHLRNKSQSNHTSILPLAEHKEVINNMNDYKSNEQQQSKNNNDEKQNVGFQTPSMSNSETLGGFDADKQPINRPRNGSHSESYHTPEPNMNDIKISKQMLLDRLSIHEMAVSPSVPSHSRKASPLELPSARPFKKFPNHSDFKMMDDDFDEDEIDEDFLSPSNKNQNNNDDQMITPEPNDEFNGIEMEDLDINLNEDSYDDDFDNDDSLVYNDDLNEDE